MDNKLNTHATKEDALKYFTSTYGPAAQVFLAWRESSSEIESLVNFKTLDNMMDIYKRNERNVGLFPHLAPNLELSNYEILFKGLEQFKLEKSVSGAGKKPKI